jgi:hypothetical protein
MGAVLQSVEFWLLLITFQPLINKQQQQQQQQHSTFNIQHSIFNSPDYIRTGSIGSRVHHLHLRPYYMSTAPIGSRICQLNFSSDYISSDLCDHIHSGLHMHGSPWGAASVGNGYAHMSHINSTY